MIPRDVSTIGTIIGLAVFAVAIVGTTVFGWTWENPSGNMLPLVIGIVAAVAGGLVVLWKRRG